jgi:hypothetical protein
VVITERVTRALWTPFRRVDKSDTTIQPFRKLKQRGTAAPKNKKKGGTTMKTAIVYTVDVGDLAIAAALLVHAILS